MCVLVLIMAMEVVYDIMGIPFVPTFSAANMTCERDDGMVSVTVHCLRLSLPLMMHDK